MKKVLLFCLSASIAFGQAGRPPVDHYSQLLDVNVSGLQVGNMMTWNGTVWVPSAPSSGAGLPSIVGQGGKFLTTDATSVFWGAVPFASLSGKPTSAAGYGIINGSNLDLWAGKTPYNGTLTIGLGKTVNFPNSFSITATDGASLAIGNGGTLGTNAFSSAAFVLQTTTVNGHALSGNVTVTKSDLGLGYLLSGTGSPEGAISAPVGSQYARTDGGAGTTFYVKQSGTGNTGWTADTLGAGSVPSGGTVGQALIKNSSTDFDASWAAIPGGSGGGTVLDVSVTTANGVSGTVTSASTHPAITLTLGAITPSSVASTGTVTGTNLSGTNTGDQTITLTGPVTGSGTGSFGTTITDNSVGLAKITGIAAGTILGNNTAGITSPIALNATQTKQVLGLNSVENTALSTWAGSTNLTTVGNLTGSPPTSSVAYSLLPVGTAVNTVAAGNDGRFPASVVGIRKSTGAGSTDTAATPNSDYAVSSAGTFNDSGTSSTPQVWGISGGVSRTVMSESGMTSVDRYSTLPPAAAFAPGTIITYIDNKTTVPTIGRNFRPLSSPADTLDGLTAAQWATNNAWLRPFIAGGLTGMGTFQWKTDGSSAWISIYAQGRASAFVDPLDARKQVNIDVSAQPTATPSNRFIPATTGDGGSVVDTPEVAGSFVTGYVLSTGQLITNNVYNKDILSNQDDITSISGSPNTTTGNPHRVPDTGDIDSVRLSSDISGLSVPFTVTWPAAAGYTDGQWIWFYDNTGTVSQSKTVVITPSAGNTINGSSAGFVLTDPYVSKRFVANGTSNWTVATSGGASNGLSIGDYVDLVDAPFITVLCNRTIDEQNLKLASTTGIGATRTITFTNYRPGERFHLLFTHNSTGSDTVVIQSAVTPSHGAGLLNLSLGANKLDSIVGHIDRNGKVYIDPPALDLTAAAPSTFNTIADNGPTNNGTLQDTGATSRAVGFNTNTTYSAFQFIASGSYTTGRVDIDMRKHTSGAPTGNVTVAICADAPRFTESGATVTSGSATIGNVLTTVVAADVGQIITGTGIPANTFVGAFDNVAHTISLSSVKGSNTAVNATASSTGVVVYGAVGAPLATSAIVNATSLPTSYSTTYTSFTGFTCNIVNGTTYWVLLNNSVVVGAGSLDYIEYRESSGFAGYANRNGSTITPSQTAAQDQKANFAVYKP